MGIENPRQRQQRIEDWQSSDRPFAAPIGYGALVDSLLDDAFAVLQHDTGEHDPEWHHQREWLAKRFQKTLRKKRHNIRI